MVPVTGARAISLGASGAPTWSRPCVSPATTIWRSQSGAAATTWRAPPPATTEWSSTSLRCGRSEEHTSELQSLMRISYAVFCLKKQRILDRQWREYMYILFIALLRILLDRPTARRDIHQL